SSWAPLFCAPVLGALAAWAGLALIALLQAAGVLQLTALHTTLDSLRHPTTALLGTAILLGMSERFLLRLEKQAEAVIDPNRSGPSDQAAPANTSAAIQRELLLGRATAVPAAAAGGTARRDGKGPSRRRHPAPGRDARARANGKHPAGASPGRQ